MPTYRIDLAYDGTDFRGMARQPGVRTVQGSLEDAIARVIGSEVETVVAGRTDAGVHAAGQVVSFQIEEPIDYGPLVRSLNSMLAGEVVVKSMVEVEAGFSARFSARLRSYRYQVWNDPVVDPLVRRSVWHVMDPLDVEAMNRAAEGFVGVHDFASFCRQADGRSSEREVISALWVDRSPLLTFEVAASAFCHQMVRSLVGFCVDAGRGKVDPGSVAAVIAARDRHAARPIAPPHGLILWEVVY